MNLYDSLKQLSASLFESIEAGRRLSEVIAWVNSGFDVDLAPDSTPSSLLIGEDHILNFSVNPTSKTVTLEEITVIEGVEQSITYVLDESTPLNAVLPFEDIGVTSVYNLSAKVQEWISANTTVASVIDMVVDNPEGSCSQSALLSLIDSLRDMLGDSTAVLSLKSFIASAGESIFPEHLMTVLQGLYLSAGMNAGRETSADELKLIDSTPHIDEFNWTVVGQLFSSLASAMTIALTMISRPLGIIVAAAGAITSSLMNIAFGDENYKITRAANGYLDIPIVALETPVLSSQPDTPLRVVSSYCCDSYTWILGGKLYRNVFLKPFLSLDQTTGLAWRFEDHFSSSIPRTAGSAVCGSIYRDHVGNHFGVDITLLPGTQNLVYAKEAFQDLSRANIAVWNSIASCVIGQDVGLDYFVPDNFTGLILVYNQGTVVTPGSTPDSYLTYRDLVQAVLALGYTFAFNPNNAKLYTKDIANLIQGIRGITGGTPIQFGYTEWASPTLAYSDFASGLSWYSCDGGVAPSAYVNHGQTFVDQGIDTDQWFQFSYVYAPNPALLCIELGALAYHGADGATTHARAIAIVRKSVRQLPTTFSFQLPTASLLGKWLAVSALVAGAAIIAGALVFTTVKISKKFRLWRIKKSLAIDKLRQHATETGTTEDTLAYINAARRFNFANTFLPGAYSYNIVSGWAEQSSNSGSFALPSSLSNNTGIADLIQLIRGHI